MKAILKVILPCFFASCLIFGLFSCAKDQALSSLSEFNKSNPGASDNYSANYDVEDEDIIDDDKPATDPGEEPIVEEPVDPNDPAAGGENNGENSDDNNNNGDDRCADDDIARL